MKIGYARVSTFEQKLESQIEVLKEAGAEEVFQEKKSFSKSLMSRLKKEKRKKRNGLKKKKLKRND